MIPIKNLDICSAREHYILLNCNCITIKLYGVSKKNINVFYTW